MSIDQERLEIALKASYEGIWKWSYTIDKIYYSDLLLDLMGYDSQESAPHLFKDLLKLFHEQDQWKLKVQLDAFLKPSGNETFGTECRYLRPDGKIRWFRIRGACNRDKTGKPIIIAGSIIDITPRKEAELRLTEDKHLLKLLSESIPVNIYFKDKDSKFVMANTATAKKMRQENATDILGKSDHDFFDAKHADKSRQDEIDIMESGHTLTGTLEREIWDANEETWCITSKYPWYDHHGNIKGTFGVSNDVTEIVDTQNRLIEVAQTYRERNELYEAELLLASEIQQAILARRIPQIPSNPANIPNNLFTADFQIQHIPMHGLAGDFYEAIPLSDHRMGILVCDVMGHGVRAGLIVAMIRGLISKEKKSASNPEQFLTNLNQGLSHILNSAGISIFSTAIYCIVDTTQNQISLSSAGHPLPIIKNGSIYSLMDPNLLDPTQSSALGLFENSSYHSINFSIDNLEEIIFYTDGIYEVADKSDQELGLDKLIHKLNKSNKIDSSSIDKLIHIAKDFTADNQFNDDVCLVSINIKH